MAGTSDVRVRRVYDQPSPDDGQRFLVDRLWPRGLSKAAAGLSEWVKDVAPSDELRRWYGHDPQRFAEFRLRYADELREPVRARALTKLNQAAKHGTITLLTATKDVDRSEAALLAEQLRAAARNRNRPQADDHDDVPGDPACWLRRVCAACGNLAPVDPPTVCPECGSAIAEV
jgi:uncharacterized protein YeaO (DUF488 family)